MPAAGVRCLSFHAEYRCRNSGVCCTSDWPIQDDQGGLLPRTERGCAFHNADAHQCEIHATRGHDALPLACRQFPRISILEPRGAIVTLSCYCPTARAMLETVDSPIAIIENAPAFPANCEYVGLDARTSLPPALCPDVLMDWNSWYEWERLSVEIWNLNEPPRQILARLSIAVEHTRTWRPGQGELIERVRAAFENASSPGPKGPGLQPSSPGLQPSPIPGPEGPGLQLSGPGLQPSSPGLQPSPIPGPKGPGLQLSGPGLHSSWRAGPSGPAVRAFLAGHAFANWPAHLGAGLRTWLRSVETVVVLLELDWTIGEIDLWLRHYADPHLLARVWSDAEQQEPHQSK